MAERLRVGVDVANLPRDRRGMGRYVRNVLREFTTSYADRIQLILLVPDLIPALTAKRYLEDLPPDVAGDVTVARRNDSGKLGLQVVWYPWNGMTWKTPVHSVATVHDCWPFVSPSPNGKIRRNEQTPFLRTAENADAIITDSAFGKAEVMTHLRVPPTKIFVVPLGVAPPSPDGTHALISNGASPATQPSTEHPPATVDASTPSAGATQSGATQEAKERYILFVGEAEERKDLPTLLAAMPLLPESLRQTVPLIVVGKCPLARAGYRPEGARVDFAGEVSDARLAELYRGASVFVLPSIYEGFGLPLLEAMSFGVPVVASDAASIPEVGDKAALYFPARDAQALAVAIEMMLTDESLATRFRAAGLMRAAEMTWDSCAEKTLEIFERVAAAGPQA